MHYLKESVFFKHLMNICWERGEVIYITNQIGHISLLNISSLIIMPLA